jgi:hypothetical protein
VTGAGSGADSTMAPAYAPGGPARYGLARRLHRFVSGGPLLAAWRVDRVAVHVKRLGERLRPQMGT